MPCDGTECPPDAGREDEREAIGSPDAGGGDEVGPGDTPGADAGADDTPEPPILIIIDTDGIPHVFADSDENAFFGAGYQMAADRLLQMEMLRRFARGRLAEVMGEAGLERDIQARAFRLVELGRADMEATRAADPERARLIAAWVAGINRRIGEILEGQVEPPFGFGADGFDFMPEPWGEEDPYVILKGANFALDKSLEFEIAVTLLEDIYPDAMDAVEIFRPARAAFSVPDGQRPAPRQAPAPGLAPWSARAQPARFTREQARQAFAALARVLRWSPRPAGSNNWAIDGRHTETGLPFVAGDPHLGFDFFGAPYPMHINSADRGGTYDVAGFAYPGTPGVALGHNRHVIWAVTSAFGDVNDIWKTRKLLGRVSIAGSWHEVSKRTEEIIVREPGLPAGQGRIERVTYEDVPGYGIVLPNRLIGIPFAGPYLTNWTGFVARPARWFLELNRVRNLDEFEQAVLRMREMNYNFLAASAEGIAYRVGVDVPRRRVTGPDITPWRAMDADDPRTLWSGEMLEDWQKPHSRGGNRGWLATANNDPFGFSQNGIFYDDPWFYGAFFAPGYRAQRIYSRLEQLVARGAVTLDEVMTLQMDTHSLLADDLVPVLLEAYSHLGSDPSLAGFKLSAGLDDVVALLERWDRQMRRESAGALVFQAFLHFLAEAVLKDDILLGFDFAMQLQAVFVLKVVAMAVTGRYPNGDQVLQRGRDFALLRAAARTASWLRDRFGDTAPQSLSYGMMKYTDFDHAFGYGMPVFQKPSHGGEDTICVSQNISFARDADRWLSSYVSVERTVGGFGPDGTPEIWINYPLGCAADPESEDTARANRDYLDGVYRRLLFAREEINRNARRRYALHP